MNTITTHQVFSPKGLKGQELGEYRELSSTDKRRQYGVARRHGMTHADAVAALDDPENQYRPLRFEDGCYSR